MKINSISQNFSTVFSGRTFGPTGIQDIHARRVMDSRGNPTVEVDVTLKDGSFGRAAVPSGASTGTREALELRDGDKSKYMGKDVSKAIENVNKKIAPALFDEDASNQRDIDNVMLKLDGTPNKTNLGANAMLGVSMAVARAAAVAEEVPLYKYLGSLTKLSNDDPNVLPVPMSNVINGGEHADNKIDLQEFMIAPVGAKNMEEAIKMNSEVFHNLKSILKKEGHNTAVGDEGGFAPNLDSSEDALKYIVRAIEKAGYTTDQVKICLDPAASTLYENGKYIFKGEEVERTREEMVDMYADWVEKYPIISIEDGMAEDDEEGWKLLTERLGGKIQIMGDDLFVTQKNILQEKGLNKKIGNSILIKLNQVGTVSETLDTMELARDNGYTTVVSHRSGETEDSFIADLAVATNSGQIKTGSMSRSDRMAKYNQLLRIAEQLGSREVYKGLDAFNGEQNKQEAARLRLTA